MKKKKNILIVMLSFVAMAFSAWNVLWRSYTSKCFAEIVKNNPDCVQISDKIYDLTPNNKSMDSCTTGIIFPKYLKFTGNYCISGAIYANTDDSEYFQNYGVILSIRPHLFKEMDFQIQIQDHTENDMKFYIFDTNRNLEVVENYGLDPQEILNHSEVKTLVNEAMNIANIYFPAD
ncbi:MAG: hypothetical protein K2O52_05245 [Oscillospiraceae bacterium]|nr:hypothetical protein [Oscillospiraceae bacterium]